VQEYALPVEQNLLVPASSLDDDFENGAFRHEVLAFFLFIQKSFR
jgi:hypothetical protein